jgi:hypothetical protein
MVSSPEDAPPLDVPRERRNLEQAVRGLERAHAVETTWLEQATLLALLNKLQDRDYHVFHYIGHGGFDKDADTGVLLLENERHLGHRVSGQRLATILGSHQSLRLAVLNACEGARTSRRDPFAGVAASLVRREVPAVIAMQFEITDKTAVLFAGQFYKALARGYTVDAALAWARLAIFADGNDIEWGTPVLIMRSPDGRIFEVPRPLEDDVPEPFAKNGLRMLLHVLRRRLATKVVAGLLGVALVVAAAVVLVALLLSRCGGARPSSLPKLSWTFQKVTSEKLPGLQKIRAIVSLPDQTTAAVGSDSGQLQPLFLSNASGGWTRQNPLPGTEPTRRQVLTGAAVSGAVVVAVGWEGRQDRDAAAWLRAVTGDVWVPACGDETVCGDKFPGGGSKWQMMWAVTASQSGGFVAVGSDVVEGSWDAAVWVSPDGFSWHRASQAAILGGDRNQEMRSVIETRKGLLVAVGSDKSEGAVWTSADGGEQWAEEEPLRPCAACQKLILYGVAETSQGDLIAVGAETLKRSDRDQAVLWRRRGTGAWTLVDTGLTHPGQRLLAIAAGSSGLTAVGYEHVDAKAAATVWRSAGGLEWTKESYEKFPGDGQREMTSVAVDASGTVVAGGDAESRSSAHDADQQDGAVWIAVPDVPSVPSSAPVHTRAR